MYTMALSLLAIAGLTLLGCAHTGRLDPALPDEPHDVSAPAVPPGAVPAAVQEPSATAALTPLPPPPESRFVPPPTAQALPQPEPVPEPRITRPAKSGQRPEVVIAEANRANRVTPTREGFLANQSAIQRYPYVIGKIYAVYTSQTSPTLILLPPGERLATPPLLDPEQFDFNLAAMKADADDHQEAIIVRALTEKADATLPILTQAGRVYLCHLQTSAGAAMAGVTWELPTLRRVVPTTRTAATSTGFPPPAAHLERLHTAYTVEPRGRVAFVPLSVVDDGLRTFIRFKESLRFTQQPAVFVKRTDGTPGVVQFTAYEVPEAPQQGSWYIVEGLHPQLELRGSQGESVLITRTSSAAVTQAREP
jgi:type IV secretory pathway VirB9-like protein